MADPAPHATETVTTPLPDTPQADDNVIDAKLAAAAQLARQRVDERRARGQPATVAEIVASRRRPEPSETPRTEIVSLRASLALVEPDPEPLPRFGAGWELVPGRFSAATLETYRPSTAAQRTALRATREWVALALQHAGPMLALIGPTGTGKSHLLYAAANELLAERRRFYARPWYKLADELRYGGRSPYAPKVQMEPHEVRGQLFGERIVLLDEVRATASTSFDDMEIAKLACHAYDGQIAVIVTSNVFPLDAVMGPPAASRFTQVVIDGPDHRQGGVTP